MDFEDATRRSSMEYRSDREYRTRSSVSKFSRDFPTSFRYEPGHERDRQHADRDEDQEGVGQSQRLLQDREAAERGADPQGW
jgi:hypothetical protein